MTEESQLTEAQQTALNKGWAPKEDWDGDPEMWVDAGEFLRRGELMDRISDQTRQLRSSQDEIKALREGMDVLTKHNKKIAEQEYSKAMRDLKEAKLEAIESGESRKVVELDDRIEELKEERRKLEDSNNRETDPKNNPQDQQPDSYVLQWVKDNPWYEQDVILKGATDALVQDYIAKNPQDAGNYRKILSHVETEISQNFDIESSPSSRKRATTIDADSVSGRTKSKKSGKGKAYSLTAEQRRIAQKFVDQGIMTMDEYAKQLGEMDNG
jgi:hypothetical protein